MDNGNGNGYEDFEVDTSALEDVDYDFYVNYSEPPPSSEAVVPNFLIDEGVAELPKNDVDIYDVLGQVLDTAGKTYTQIASQKYIQSYKKVPSVQTGMEKQIYLPLTRVRQTGIDTGISTVEKTFEKTLSEIAKSPNIYIYLLIGVGLLIFVFAKKIN